MNALELFGPAPGAGAREELEAGADELVEVLDGLDGDAGVEVLEPDPQPEPVAGDDDAHVRLWRATRDSRRSRRKHEVPGRTISYRGSARRERAVAEVLAEGLEDVYQERPKTRGDCERGERPCPWVSCHHHLYLDVSEKNGSLKLNFPDVPPEEMERLAATCALDLADEGGATLDKVGAAINVTRERVRQIERKAQARLEKTKTARHAAEAAGIFDPLERKLRLPVFQRTAFGTVRYAPKAAPTSSESRRAPEPRAVSTRIGPSLDARELAPAAAPAASRPASRPAPAPVHAGPTRPISDYPPPELELGPHRKEKPAMGHMRKEPTPIQQKLFEIVRARTWHGGEPDEALTLAVLKQRLGDVSNGTVAGALESLRKRGLVSWKGRDFAGTLRATEGASVAGAAAPATASRRSKASANGNGYTKSNGHGHTNGGGGRRGIRIDQETLARLRAVEDELEKKLESLRTTIALLEG